MAIEHEIEQLIAKGQEGQIGRLGISHRDAQGFEALAGDTPDKTPQKPAA